ncbi:hypothetical protein, variant 1, partial [Aphanomyces astaci]
MAQVHAMARMLLHVPQGDVEDASELVRLACVERDIAMDEAASSIVSLRRANDECERLRQVVNRLKLKKPVATPSHKATGHHTNLLLNLDFILSVFRNKLGLDIHVLDLKRHVLDQTSSVSTRHTVMFKSTLDELRDVYAALSAAQVKINQLETDLSIMHYSPVVNPTDQTGVLDNQVQATYHKTLHDTRAITMAEWEAKVTALTRRNAELEETIQSMQLAQVRHQTTMDALTTDRDALVAQLNTTAAAVADLKMENHQIHVQAIQRKHDHVRQSLNSLNAEWAHRYNDKSQAVDETMQTDELEDTASVEWLQDMLEHERATTIHCRNELDKAQAAAETADNEHVNAIKQRSEASQTLVSSLELAVDGWKAKCSSLELKCNELEAGGNALAKQVARMLEEACRDLQNQVVALTSTNHEHKTAADVLGAHLAMHVRHWKRHQGTVAS